MNAIEQERLIRNAALLPVRERVGIYEVVPLTLRRHAALSVLQSPYLPPFQTPSEGDTIAALWILSPQWCPDNSTDFARARKKFLAQRFDFIPPLVPFFLRTRFSLGRYEITKIKAQIEHAAIVKELREYLAESYQDAPRPVPGRNLVEPPQYYSDAIAIACDLAREYGGGLELYFDMNMKLIFQAMKESREYRAAKAGRPAALENPSDSISDAELGELNRALHASGKEMHPDAVEYFKARNN